MRIWSIALLLAAMPGCSSGTQPAKPSAESDNDHAQLQKIATPEKQAASVAVKPHAAVTAGKHATPDQFALGDSIVSSVGMILVPIPAGQFQMGSPDSDSVARSHEKPRHLVKITRPFYLSAHEVTRHQYEQVMKARPWEGLKHLQHGPDYPATNVSWNDAVEFCRRLSDREGMEYRLPTEAEWEYACRAGTTTLYSFGDDASRLEQHAWYLKNASSVGERYGHRVGKKLPNPWGLYDMHGNVWEWCQDWYAPYGSEKVLSDPAGPARGGRRVLRGGSFNEYAEVARSADRDDNRPGNRYVSGGFRVARTYR